MSTAAPQALDRNAVPWLFWAALVTTLPHVEHQPLWLSVLGGLFFVWAVWLWWRGTRLPGRWALAICVILCCAGILLEFRTLFGRDSGVAMLFAFMALKLLELKSRRDAHVVVMLGFFLLLTHYFFSQSIPTGLWLLFAMLILTATLIRLHGGPASTPRPTLRLAGLMILQALPFMLVLYLLFPRVSGPLWGLPQDAYSARTGLSETMSPGSIANLALSGEIAFRARFEGPPPPSGQRYWRGPVLEDYDGRTWERSSFQTWLPPRIERLSQEQRYALTLEASPHRWLLALDAPFILPANSRLATNLTVYNNRPVRQRQRFEFASATAYRFNVEESADVLRRNLRLPPDRNPQSRALGESWQQSGAPEARVQNALTLFRH